MSPLCTVHLDQAANKPRPTDELLGTKKRNTGKPSTAAQRASRLHPSCVFPVLLPSFAARILQRRPGQRTSLVLLLLPTNSNRHLLTAALGSRRWSGAARWSIRELNELPHYLQHRWVGGKRKRAETLSRCGVWGVDGNTPPSR